MKIDVLDKGFVRLIDYVGGDISIVRAARVSYDADWRSGTDSGSDTKLINYLMKNRHTSPFEAVTFTFEVKAPIFVFRQWHRHRTWSYNEVSARYAELPEDFYVPELEQITTQSKNNKQMRTDELNPNAASCVLSIKECAENAFVHYRAMLELGCPRAFMRCDLLGVF